MQTLTLSSHLTVAEVMQHWPATVPVFIRHCLACVGCPFAPFETLDKIPEIFGLPLDEFMRAPVRQRCRRLSASRPSAIRLHRRPGR